MSLRGASLAVVAILTAGCGRVGFRGMEADAGADARVDSSIVRLRCGDGIVSSDESCDDANDIDGDGCDSDCRFSCEAAADCDDGQLCNGGESCIADQHRCQGGVLAPDGTECGQDLQCRSGTCAPLTCGDLMLQPPEECDDGNDIEGDGCDSDCTFSCVDDLECDDGRPCNGPERCLEHRCLEGISPVDGALCDRDEDPTTRDICRFGSCTPSVCGDGFLDVAAEICDDGNVDDGDGCDSDCTITCTSNLECDDGDACNGVESCDIMTLTCLPGSPLLDGTQCPGGACRAGMCITCPDILTADSPEACFRACDLGDTCTYAPPFGSQGQCCCDCRGGALQIPINDLHVEPWLVKRDEACAVYSCMPPLCPVLDVCAPPPSCVSGRCESG